jgi:hypothetical protein
MADKPKSKFVVVRLSILQARALDIAVSNSLNSEEDARALFNDKEETVSAAYMAATKLTVAINKVNGYSEKSEEDNDEDNDEKETDNLEDGKDITKLPDCVKFLRRMRKQNKMPKKCKGCKNYWKWCLRDWQDKKE